MESHSEFRLVILLNCFDNTCKEVKESAENSFKIISDANKHKTVPVRKGCFIGQVII